MIEWKFNVGDIVHHVAGDLIITKGNRSDAASGKQIVTRRFGNRAARFIILELLSQTCHGGTQQHYRCRMINPEGVVYENTRLGNGLIDLCEFELEPFAPILEEEVVGPML